MIVIRREQLAALTDRGVEGFARALAERLRQEGRWPTLRSESDAVQAVVEGVAEALRLGLLAEPHVERFVVCRLVHGDGFPLAHAWSRALVDDASLTPVQLLERLEAHAAEESAT